MRDHDPRNAGFEADDTATAGDSLADESVRALEAEDAHWSRPSLRRLGCWDDVHERPTLVP